MKKTLMAMCLILIIAASCCCMATVSRAGWAGVDETVVEKYANNAGRPGRKPFINTDQGDLLLFVFLLAGTAGGFAGGYYFRILFHEKRNVEAPDAND